MQVLLYVTNVEVLVCLCVEVPGMFPCLGELWELGVYSLITGVMMSGGGLNLIETDCQIH